MKQNAATYYGGELDTVIDDIANTVNYVFGHSTKLDGICGFWVFVEKQILVNYGYYAQKAIGSLGSATRFYKNGAWSNWVKEPIDYLKTVSIKSQSVTVNANVYKAFNVNVAQSGYKAIAVAGVTLNNEHCCLVNQYISTENVVTIGFRNVSSSSQTLKDIYVHVLYMKT